MPHTHEGSFTLIRADQRGGKTLTMSIFALQAHQAGRKIFTNIAYTFPRTTPEKPGWEPLYFQELDLNDPEIIELIRNGVLTLDELWMILDSRSGMSAAQKKFTRFLYQLKKQGIDLYGTTHDLHLIDRRARENFDYLIDVQALPVKRPDGAPPEALRLHITNGPLNAPFSKTVYLRCRPFLGLYDTNNTFDPLEPPEGFTPPPKPKRKPYEMKHTRQSPHSSSFTL